MDGGKDGQDQPTKTNKLLEFPELLVNWNIGIAGSLSRLFSLLIRYNNNNNIKLLY
jgi:hypothetical protein